MSLLDKMIGYFSPERALRRTRAKYQMRLFEAAQPGRRGNSWRSRGLSQNSELMGAIGPLRDRARNMGRNSPWAPRMLDVITAHTIGTGLRPVPNTGDDKLDVKVMQLWEEWNAQADIEGNLSFDAMQALAMRSIIESGEVVLRYIEQPMRRNRDAAVPLKLQLMEGDFIDHQRDGLGYGSMPATGITADTKRSRLGVGLGEWDRRTGLWLFPYHPGEMTPADVRSYMSEFVPQDEITHTFRTLRPGQVRGVTWFAPMLMMAGDLADFMDALIMKAKVEACFSAFVTNSNEYEELMSPSPASSGLSASAANPDAELTTLEPGMIKELKQGQDIKFAQPTSAGQVEPMLMYPLMAMAAAVGATYDQISGDLRGANYSSLRAGKIDFKKLVEQNQEHVMKPRFCVPVWRKFISRAIMAGELPEHESRYPVSWVTPAWESINPKFDQNAEELSVRAGRMSPQEFIASWGYDWRKVQDDFAAFFERADKLGLKFDIDPRQMTKAGSFQPVPKDPNAPGDGAPNGGGNGSRPNGGGNGGVTDANGNEIDLDQLQELLDAAGEGGLRFPFTDNPLVGAAFCVIAKRQHVNGEIANPFRACSPEVVRAALEMTNQPWFRFSDREWNEEDHPRDELGQFTDSGGGDSGGGSANAPPAGGAIEKWAKKTAGSGPTGDSWTFAGGPHGEKWQDIAQQIADAFHGAHNRIKDSTIELTHVLNTVMLSAQNYTDWRKWYDDARQSSERVFGEYAPMFERFLAASSINTPVKQNVRIAVRATIHYIGGGKFDTRRDFPGTTDAMRKQIKAAAEGRPLSGPKVEAFDANLGGNMDEVTVDRWMKVLLFEHPRLSGEKKGGPQGQIATQVVKTISAKMGWKPAEMQAVLWAVTQILHGERPEKYSDILRERASQIRTWVGRAKALRARSIVEPVALLQRAADAFENAASFMDFIELIKQAFPEIAQVREWNEEDHPRDELGQFTDAGGGMGAAEETATAHFTEAGTDVGKQKTATEAEADINPAVVEVGGDEWNRATALRLEREYARAKPSLEAIIDRGLGEEIEVPAGPPETWGELSVDDQDKTYEQWKENTSQEFVDNEITNWHENGDARYDAMNKIADDVNHGNDDDWVRDALKENFTFKGEDLEEHHQGDEDEKIVEKADLPFLLDEINDALRLEVKGEGDSAEFEVSFSESNLASTMPVGFEANQQTLPGVTPEKPSDYLSDKMREQIADVIKERADDRISDEESDLEPPSYIYDSAKEMQQQAWDEYDETTKLELAKQYDIVMHNDEGTKATVFDHMPSKFDPIGPEEGSTKSYRETKALAAFLSRERAAQLLVDRGLVPDMTDARELVVNQDSELWSGWKAAATSPEGKLLQVAAAKELGGRLRTVGKKAIDEAKVIERANHDYSAMGGFDGIKAMVRAKWETTQYLLDRAGIQTLDLYRGINVKEAPKNPPTTPFKVQQIKDVGEKGDKSLIGKWTVTDQQGIIVASPIDSEEAAKASAKLFEESNAKLNADAIDLGRHEVMNIKDAWSLIRLPEAQIPRNGAASTTTDRHVANNWGGGGGETHVTLRFEVPRTAVISVPAYGQNIHSEHEVVVAGTSFKNWDAWLGTAPSIKDVPFGAPAQEGKIAA